MSTPSPKRSPPCIFCDEPRSSAEHFWPEWMHTLLPRTPNPHHERWTVHQHPVRGEDRRGRTNAQGGVQTIRIKVVCANCNRGWMSRLEERVKPIVSPLILGEPIALDHEQTTTIAKWVALKCIVAEHAARDCALTPEDDRKALRLQGTIPNYFRIYVANHDGNECAYVRHSHCLAFDGPKPKPELPTGIVKNVQTITFYLGRIFVHMNACRTDDFELESSVLIPSLYNNSRIWPPQHYEMVWPRNPIFSRKQVDSISLSLPTFLNAHSPRWGGDMP